MACPCDFAVTFVCRTMKGRVGGVPEELGNNKLRPFEESCSEIVVPKSGEPSNLTRLSSVKVPVVEQH